MNVHAARVLCHQLAAALRRIRERKGLSQEAVAFAAGVTFGTVARLELGQTAPTWATVRAIANGLGVTLADLGAEVEAEQ